MREVTERDFRMPEFRDAKTEDYEFRADGKIVRKDRWETAVQRIREIVGIHAREFEISEVIDAVRAIADQQSGWIELYDEEEEKPALGDRISITLSDGSILCGAITCKDGVFSWGSMNFSPDIVVAWRQ